jgi:hypothetical protein
MARRIDRPELWLARAEEARDLADQLRDPESRRIMLGIAVSYVVLAQIAEARDGTRGESASRGRR